MCTIRSNKETSLEIINVEDESDVIIIDKLGTQKEKVDLKNKNIYKVRIKNKNDELIVFVTGATNIE